MQASRLSAKGQVTIPRKVREALGLRPGDSVAYEVRGRSAVIHRVNAFDAAFHLALADTLDEWATPRTTRPFVICEPWDVVVVPFPFVERRGTERRPALVISKRAFNEHGHSLLLMITTSGHAPWPGDVALEAHRAAGLASPCIARLKAFTLHNQLLLKRIGRLAEPHSQRIAASIQTYLFPG